MGRFQDENGRLTAAPGPARGWAAMAGWVARGVGGRWTLPAAVAPSIFLQEITSIFLLRTRTDVSQANPSQNGRTEGRNGRPTGDAIFTAPLASRGAASSVVLQLEEALGQACGVVEGE
jgi:hypothetical protein